MLIAQEERDRLFAGILGNNVTPVQTTVETPVYSPVQTVTATPTNGGAITVTGSWQVVTSPADYAKHALEYALKAFQSALASLGYGRPWIRTGSQKPIPPTIYDQILDYAYRWSRVRSYPKSYTGLVDGQGYMVKDSGVVNMTTKAYLENYLTRYYLFVPQAAALSPTLPTATLPTRRPVTTLTPTPTTVMPAITANVPEIVRHNLGFSQIPIMAGTVRGDIYDRIVDKSIIDILSVEYFAPKKSPPPGITWDALKARNRAAVLSYINSLGIKRGSTSQTPDFIPTATGTSPLPYSQERQWWASTDRERAEWAVKAVMRDMGIRYVKGGTMITPQQADQVLAGALQWLQAVASDQVFVRDAGDRRDMQIAMGLINLNLLGNMGIGIGTKPDWQERASAAVTWWLGRTADKTMTSTEYTEYLRQVTKTAISYWGNALYTYLQKGGAAIATPSEATFRAYVDSLLKQAISIAAPIVTILPITTPTPTLTPIPTIPYIQRPTPTPTPTPAVIMTPAAAAADGLSEALREGNYQNLARATRPSPTGPVLLYLPADLYDKMMEEAVAAAKRIYADAGGDPSSLTDQDWLNQIRLINNTARDRRFVRDTTIPTVTAIVPITPVVTPTPTVSEPISLMDRVFELVLPKFGLAQRYPRPYYIPDASRREVAGEILWEGGRAERERGGDPIYARQQLQASDIDRELRERNILPESEYTEIVTMTPVVSGDAALREWAKTAPIFETYAQCRTAAQDQVGRVPDQWRDCLTESDMIDLAVSHALIQRGIRPYPGSLELPEAAFDSVAEVGLAITQAMVYQRTYTPVVGGKVLQLAQ